MNIQATNLRLTCYHCGENCATHSITSHDKNFCCDGCKTVFEILNTNGLCDYYKLSEAPGSNQKYVVREGKFSFLDDGSIARSIISYTDEKQTHITFYLPAIHCSSCLWLLENLHQINQHIISSKVNFEKKEADLVFNHTKISLRTVAELLTSIGYEPYISLHHADAVKPKMDKSKIYKLGVAGFCFANIMLFSFPDYLGIDASEKELQFFFRWLSLGLSLPVFFYSASEFYISAYAGLKHRFLNIDAPVVLAIFITFGRSLYEIITGTGTGYLDSVSGIIFFMLAGRVLQEKTYQQLNFERDYTSYFPLSVKRIRQNKAEDVMLQDVRVDDTLLIHNEELIPADGIVTRGKAVIDYSFVTGESAPVIKEMGEIIYAGGKQTGSNIEILVIKEVAQSYLTRLWNRSELTQLKDNGQTSFVHRLSKNFTCLVLSVAVLCGLYWYITDVTKMWTSVTAILIVACPCALLLSHTFTNSNIIRHLSRSRLYLRNAQVIENIADVTHIVFDKTGTLTTGSYPDVQYEGDYLTENTKQKIVALAGQSIHPASKAICAYFNVKENFVVNAFRETPGKGIEGFVGDEKIRIGSLPFLSETHKGEEDSLVYVAADDKVLGKFSFKNQYRPHLPKLIKQIKQRYPITVLSGDNAGEKKYLSALLGDKADILFRQTPEDKLEKIVALQKRGEKVMMIGDGLNDAGALKQAHVGIAVTDNNNNFTPASDAILEAAQLPLLVKMIQLCKISKQIIVASFIVSLLYNVIGLYFAVQGMLSPVIAAVLMPCSSVSILLMTFGASNLAARSLRLDV